MKNHDIVFDKREKRIGFIKANCSINIPEWISTKPGNNHFYPMINFSLGDQPSKLSN